MNNFILSVIQLIYVVNHLHSTTGIHPLVNKKTSIETLTQVKNLHLKRIDRYMHARAFYLGENMPANYSQSEKV